MTLSNQSFRSAVRSLCRRDGDFARVVRAHGPPPFWKRKPGFATLLYIILEQQVSLASAKAAYQKLLTVVDGLTPESFLGLDDRTLLVAGFSRQKTRYGRCLAEAIVSGELNLRGLARRDDGPAHAELTKIKGIGRWTSDIYLMMALRRPDIWPVGDLALVTAAQQVKRLRTRPGPEKLEKLGARWQPFRSVAAHILWHHYLSQGSANGKK